VATFKSKGIILKRQNFGEADRVLTVLTEERGKIRVIAKGVRKTLSKLAGHLEPFCVTEFLIVECRNLDIVSGAAVKKCHLNLRGNLESIQTAQYLAEIIDKMLPEEEKHAEIYELLDEVLEHLNIGSAELLVSYFEINFLSSTGFHPELGQCVHCGKKLGKANKFDFESGGLRCNTCGGGRPISNDAIKVLRLFLAHRLTTINKIKTKKVLTNEVSDIISDYIRHVNQKEFKSKKYLVKLN
jgi:DNA repair protein RecO (recombination protein O)